MELGRDEKGRRMWLSDPLDPKPRLKEFVTLRGVFRQWESEIRLVFTIR